MKLDGNTILMHRRRFGHRVAAWPKRSTPQAIRSSSPAAARRRWRRRSPPIRGMAFQTLDVEDPAAIRAFAAEMTAKYPALNVLINNAGVMKAEDLLAEPFDLSDAEATITTNLLGRSASPPPSCRTCASRPRRRWSTFRRGWPSSR